MGEVVQLKKENNVVMDWLEQFKSEKTKSTYDYVLRKFFDVKKIEFINEWMIKKIKFDDIKKYLNKLFNEGLSDNTVKMHKATLSSLIEYCIDEEIINENPLNDRRIKKLIKNKTKKGEERKRVLSIEESRNILNNIENKYYRNLIALMLRSGMRVSEVINIKFVDFEYRNNGWFINVIGKGRKCRVIPYKEEYVNEIKDYMKCYKIKDDEKLFNISVRQVNRIIKKYCNEFCIENFSAHSTRRTYATNAIKNGIGVKDLQGILGHANSSTTDRYFVEYEKYNSKLADIVTW